jgi:methyl-accepting chemotaxis protein
MIRDFDRNETELRDLRTAVDMIDAGLRRFATGDIRSTLDQQLPLRHEGMRRDFNRGVANVTRAVDTILGNTQSLRDDAEILRDAQAETASARASRTEKLSAMTGIAAASDRIAKQQVAATQHVATIAHNARLDMRRPKEAAAAALKMIEAIEAAGNEADWQDRMATLKAKAEEIGRELDAMGLYVDALADHVQDLTTVAERQATAASATSAGLDELTKSERASSPDAITASITLDRITRGIGDIDREASRFMKVTVVTAPQPPRDPDDRRPFLRLVKT